MAKLTASWRASSKYGNAVVVGDFEPNRKGANLKPFVTDISHGFARFLFGSTPTNADNVVVKVEEKILDLNGRRMSLPTSKGVPEGPTKEFHGRIENGTFIASELVSGKLSKKRNNEFRLTGPEGKNTIRAHIHDPERVSSHTVTLTATYEVGGKIRKFKGTSELHVRFPLAMVVPKGTARLDTALNMIPKYAKHWQGLEPDFRHFEGVQMVVTKNVKKLLPSHYDGIVAALERAALNATAGVVALSVGHGGFQGQAGTAFFNLVPEDNKKAVTKVDFLLRINQTDLKPFDKPPKPGGVKSTPNYESRVRLNALDRIAEALAKTPICRLILHTCNAGNDPDFIQLVANRLRIPVQAQTDFIFFQPSASFYQKDGTASLPRDERFWPIHRLGSLKIPSKVEPPKFKV